MPGESMLIERLMVVFARRYYECNPGYVHLLTTGARTAAGNAAGKQAPCTGKPHPPAVSPDAFCSLLTPSCCVACVLAEKTKELKDAFDAFVAGAEGPVTLDGLGPIVRSLGGDLKWMKDDEIEEMTAITVGVSPRRTPHHNSIPRRSLTDCGCANRIPKEFRFVRSLYFKSVGIEAPGMTDAEMETLMTQVHIAATAARKKSAAGKVVKKLDEVEKSLVSTRLGLPDH